MNSDILEEKYFVLLMASEKWEVLVPFWQTCCIHPKGRISFSRSSSERFVAKIPVRLLFRVLYLTCILTETLKIKALL
jgi:hypothetical protein